MNEMHQHVILQRLERVLIAFCVLAVLFLLAVYVADPNTYTKTLMLTSSPTERYPVPVTLFLIGILVFISILVIGIIRHWRWVFWLIFVAFGFSILEVPATILQLTGVISDPYPIWYSITRMGVALIQVIIAIWMGYIYLHYGVWAAGKKKTGLLSS